MSRKGVNCPLGWTLVAENIENVERVRLDVETQRELGCLVGEHVFLEYPWAFVSRGVVTRLSKQPESPLAAFAERIEAYGRDTFLVGYSSTRLISDHFVICLTVEACSAVCERNRKITRSILSRIIGGLRRSARPWNCLGSETEVDEAFPRDTRQSVEIEIVIPGRALGLARRLCDRDSSSRRDSYVQLVHKSEGFQNIERRCISRSCQTNLQPREAFAQTCPRYPRNAWTQYAYEDISKEEHVDEDVEEEKEQVDGESERNDDERSKERNGNEDKGSEEGPREKTPLELFLEDRLQEMIENIRYNAAVNLHVDDIRSLRSKSQFGKETLCKRPAFREQLSFADSSLTENKAVSGVSLRPTSAEYMAISYANVPIRAPSENKLLNEREFRCGAVLWKFDDPLRPQLQLQDHREVCCVSFCPSDGDVVIGGCSTGHVILWIITDYSRNDKNNKHVTLGTLRGSNVPVARAIIVSDKDGCHRLPVRRICWMPARYKIESSGKLTSSSTPSGAQFLTASEDSVVAFWNLPCLGGDHSNGAFRPIFRLRIKSPAPESRDLIPLCLCLPSINVLQQLDDNHLERSELNPKERDYMQSLWIGCVEGLVKCTWEGQVVDEDAFNVVDCEMSKHSCVHDGPVTEITRSPHLEDVLLTVGGRVLAIWKDDHLDSPLFWRRTCCRYTACCWASEPGVFVLGSQQGELEVWDIKNESSWPVFSQTVSSKSITCLFLLDSSKTIGVGDSGGFFRSFKGPEIFDKEDTFRRMDWFEEYAWKEARRKKVFASWQSDFLANDPLVVAKRSARRDEERHREVEETREKLRSEQKERLRLKAEKRARSALIPKDVAWKSKEYERMKSVLLSKKNLDPSELEAKRLPIVALAAEREEKLKKAEDRVARSEDFFSKALTAELPELFKSKEEGSEVEESLQLEKSVDYYVQRFLEVRDRTRKILHNNFGGLKLEDIKNEGLKGTYRS